MTTIALHRNKKWRNLIIGMLIAGLSLGSTAWAGPQPKHRGREYPRPGHFTREIPRGHQSVRVGRKHYQFHDGVFYRHQRDGYRVVRAPRGARIRHLPLGVETLIVAGITYFVLAGVFYQRSGPDYVVVDQPAYVPSPVTRPAASGQVLAVDVSTLNVRSGPGLQHIVTSQVYLGQRLVIQAVSANWFYVSLPDGGSGWVMSQYTRLLNGGANG